MPGRARRGAYGGVAARRWRGRLVLLAVVATLAVPVVCVLSCGRPVPSGRADGPAGSTAPDRAAGAEPDRSPNRRSATGRAAPRGIANEAHRIVSLVPAVTEMIFAIGAGPRVVAVSSFDAYPPQVRDLPKVGALIDPDLERIIALRPDLVVIDRGQTDLAEQFRRAGIGAFPHALGGLGNIAATMERLGEVTGRSGAARRVIAAIDAQLAAVQRRVAGRRRPATLLVFGREPGTLRNVYASGGMGFLHDLVELAGGRNVFAGVTRESLQATTEAILAASPEVIIELRYGASVVPGSLEAERASWNVLASVPAVRDGRIHVLVGDELVVPGPRVAATAERFAEALHPATRTR